jgi:hypothetical protein
LGEKGMAPVSGEAYWFVLAMEEDVFLYEIDGLKSKIKMRLRREAFHRKVFEGLFFLSFAGSSFTKRALLDRAA